MNISTPNILNETNQMSVVTDIIISSMFVLVFLLLHQVCLLLCVQALTLILGSGNG